MPTEQEMKEFFQSVIDNVATLSTQANRVEGLERQVNELYERIRGLEADNQSLRQELNQANSRGAEVQDMLQRTQESLDAERNVTQGLRDTLIQRDSKVQATEHERDDERQAHRITTSERDDARQKISELDSQVSNLRESFASVSSERDHFRDEASKLERENVELRQRIDRINSVLNPQPMGLHAVG